MHGCVSSFFTTDFRSVAVNNASPADHMNSRMGMRATEAYRSPSLPSTPSAMGCPINPALEQMMPYFMHTC